MSGSTLLLFACLFGAFLSSASNTMVNVALPEMGRVFDASLTLIQWVVLLYVLTSSSSMAIAGGMGDRFGSARVYRLGLLLFAAGGVASGLAPNLGVLLGARFVQALGSSMFAVSVAAMLTAAFPEERRGRVLGMQATAASLGLAMGPAVGGLVAQVVGWRGIFGVTSLLAAVGLWLAWRYIPSERGREGVAELDLTGSLLLVGALVPGLLALSQVQQWGIGSGLTLGALAVGGLAAIGLVLVERRTASPILDLDLLSHPYFARSTLALVTQSISTFPPLFLMPFYLVNARGLSLGAAGLIISALPICMVLTAPLAGVLSDRFGSAPVATGGMVLVGASLLALAQFGPDTPLALVAASLAGVGAGAALGNAANATALMSAVPPSRRGMASGTLGTARYIGQSVGVALTSSVIALTVGGAEGASSLPGFAAAFLTLTVSASISAGLSAARGERPRFEQAPGPNSAGPCRGT